MALTYQSPGVYVEEFERGVKPIQGVGTSMAAFVGITAEASRKAIDPDTGERLIVEDRLNKPTLVTSWTQYTRVFGEFAPDAYLPDAVYGYFANGGGPCYVTSIRALNEGDDSMTAASAEVPSTGKSTSFVATSNVSGEMGNQLQLIVKHDTGDDGKATGTFTVTVGGQTVSGLSMKKSDDNYIGDAQFDAVTISDIGVHNATPDEGSYSLSGGGSQPLHAADYIGSAANRTGLEGLEAIEDVRLLVCPDLVAGYDGSDEADLRIKIVQEAMIKHCERLRYRFAVLDTPPGLSPSEVLEWYNFIGFDSSYAAVYYPWIEIADLSGGGTKLVPPSGHIVGLYNRTDSERGVHKAPANEVVRGAVVLETHISRGEQDNLNPRGINCIRSFAGRGIRVWGGRTLSRDGSWRYINVRRLFIYVEASMDAGLQWVVFEPNDRTLWAKIRRDVTSFLRSVWGSGALFGATEDQAFYVKCDGELNSSDVRDMGQLIIEVGMSPVKPAEFVIFRISQWAGANAEAGGG
ncbi:MAG: phage tail sheath subtilisin-like domain-containing protein [Chloroflexota bacterium]